ncbi:hypothetical protein BJ165DRAFT_1534541 [Panaeolus papilionaceus]|nr:hypothetical protein BJ165DRAFT_1534541 [Panaeolus papilionaceus]
MHTATTVFSLLSLASAFLLGVNAQDAIARSCNNFSLESDHFLRASCSDGRGGTTNSALDLNACVGTSGTSLVCQPNGNYAAFGCSGCYALKLPDSSGVEMVCSCANNGQHLTLLILDACVVNRSGLLACK